MELKQIIQLMGTMKSTGATKMSIKKEGFELVLERAEPKIYQTAYQAQDCEEDAVDRIESAFQKRPAAITLSGKESHGLTHSEAKKLEDSSSLFATSPMVGTFYSSPSPDQLPFVKVGDLIEKNTVVCIVEAMKVMNEVKSGVTGVVTEVLVESGLPVEFGTKLFRITPQ